MKATCVANSNIAFVKYWGKKDDSLNIPMNPSISMTLDLNTTTTVEFSRNFKEDEFILNNKFQKGEKLVRVIKFLDIARRKANIHQKARVFSVNGFPTASGIASSASGFAALAGAVSKVLGLSLDKRDLSELARQGSGSACRSIYGGFVEWSDKYAVQIKDYDFWPEIRDVIVIVEEKEKLISSREGMKQTVLNSRLYKKRLKSIQTTLDIVKKSILDKNFPVLAEEIMKESDNMHACIEEVGIKYLNEESLRIKEKIKKLNRQELTAGYTFDAGANAHIITLEKYLPRITGIIKNYKIIKPGQGVQI